MDILVCFDHKFLIPCGVMLQSLIVNNKQHPITIHAIVSQDVTEYDRETIRKILSKALKDEPLFYIFDESLLDNYPGLVGTHWDKSIYYRLFCASILPKGIDKILYLDCDVIVYEDISDLWNEDIADFGVAAVRNPNIEHRNLLFDYGLHQYFNSGVLLINLKDWRNKRIENLFIDIVAKEGNRLTFPDQDVLNISFRNSLKLLPLKYNVQHQFLYTKSLIAMDMKEQIDELVSAVLFPSIIHFTGSIKPWMRGSFCAYKNVYKKYLKMTEWSDCLYKQESSFKVTYRIVRKMCKRTLIMFGLIDDHIERKTYRLVQRKFKSE